MIRPDIRFALGLDGLSLWLFVLTSILMITAICASWESIKERAASYYAFLLALQTGLLGLFASLDVVLFYIFFEFTLIPLFFLIGLWGGPQRRRAAVTFFLYTLAGSLLTLAGCNRLGCRALSVFARKRPDILDPRADAGPGCLAMERVAQRRFVEQSRRSSSSCCSWRASPSRCRCFRSTPGCRWRTSKRPRPDRSSWPACCSRSAAMACCGSTSA